MSDDLLALVNHLRLDRFTLIAAAYGGFGGLDFALRFPERLDAFVLSASQGGVADPEYVATRERVVSPEIRALPIHLRELGPSYRTEHPDGVREWQAIAEMAEHSTTGRQRTALRIDLPLLNTLAVPTLLIAGGADLLAPPGLMRLLAARIPNAQFATVGEAGHCVHWEYPSEWNAIVLDFLRA
jgi:pimeloyl-ACP methyl ester carboxylesterase